MTRQPIRQPRRIRKRQQREAYWEGRRRTAPDPAGQAAVAYDELRVTLARLPEARQDRAWMDAAAALRRVQAAYSPSSRGSSQPEFTAG